MLGTLRFAQPTGYFTLTSYLHHLIATSTPARLLLVTTATPYRPHVGHASLCPTYGLLHVDLISPSPHCDVDPSPLTPCYNRNSIPTVGWAKRSVPNSLRGHVGHAPLCPTYGLVHVDPNPLIPCCNGNSNTRRAPRPGPSLSSVTRPPASAAKTSTEGNPKPVPRGFVE